MPVTTVRSGIYELEVGDPVGTIVSRREDLEKVETSSRPGQAEQVENVIDRAGDTTTKVERGNALFQDLADGSLEPAQITNSVDSLVGLLEKLDREGEHEDAIRVARVLSKLLTLARRWADLLKALRAAERVGELLGDSEAVAWAKHELGTTQLVGGDVRGAEQNLQEACEIRRQLGNDAERAATERNLDALRTTPAPGPGPGPPGQDTRPVIRRLLPQIVAAALLFVVGIAGGAAVAGSGDGDTSVTRTATETTTETENVTQTQTATETETETVTETTTITEEVPPPKEPVQ